MGLALCSNQQSPCEQEVSLNALPDLSMVGADMIRIKLETIVDLFNEIRR
jgi:hypothetical protein